MIITHYAHRLPANHDIGLIRARAKERGPLWDAVPELYFKGFLLREKGRHGSIANNYSSLYLWRQDEAFRDFLVSGRYQVVTDAFGRAEIQTRFALDARKGHGLDARFAIKEELDIPLDADLTAVFASEIERTREVAERPGTVAAAVGVDTQNWKFTRILLSEHEPTGREAGTSYEILHLAKPLLETLPQGAAG
ncbi:DUF4865 family protein [Agrobacterium rhizogenes]|nr:DUF4865 family protein [Rhizobium rhizogenes]